MKLRVKYTAQLRTALGRGEEDVELPDGSSLAALLTHVATHGGQEAMRHVTGPNGHALGSLLVVVNDVVVPPQDASSFALGPGDVVTLLPPIAGG